MKNGFLKIIFTGLFLLLAGLAVSFSNVQMMKLPDEPADPDKADSTLWKHVGPGLHSGFGSVDIAFSKSIPPQGKITESIRVQGWKGERVNCLLLVWSRNRFDNVRIKAGRFGNGRDSIGSDRVSVSVVKYVLTGEFNGCGAHDLKKGPVHLSPDILVRTTGLKLSARESRPLWISIDIPSDLPAGKYQGTISLQPASGPPAKHAITIEVLNKQLPSPADWSFHLDLWQHPDAVARYSGVKLWSPEHFNLLRPMLTRLARAGQKCITTTIVAEPWNHQTFDDFGSMVKWTRLASGRWKFDYSIFDQYVNLAMECGITQQINCYSMVPVGNQISYFDEGTSKTVVTEVIPGTKKYEDLWRAFLPDFRDHLRQKGWLNRTTLALDEREEKEMRDLFGFLKQNAPEFKITMAGFYYETLNPSIYDFSSNWRHTAKISGAVMESRRKSGLKTTYYVACSIPKPNNFTFSPPAESCYEGWFAAAMGFDGFLRWAYNSWPENPFTDSRYIKWPAGDSYLVYPEAQSSVRFERLREGIQDYEKIRILKADLAGNPSQEAAFALKRLNGFLEAIDTNTLESKPASTVVNEGKQLLYEIVKSVNADQPSSTGARSDDPGLKLMGNRFLTFTSVIRVRQIETTRDSAEGPDETSIHSPAVAQAFRDTIAKAWPGARITWAFSWLALKDQRPDYQSLRELVASFHYKYGDEITFIPGGYFANMYSTREQVNRDLHDALKMVSEMVGHGYRPKSVVAGFLAADNLRFLAGEEGIHVCQGNIWSQHAIDNGDGDGSISYPYYPSREHFLKAAQSSADQIDCVNLDGWTCDFLTARRAGFSNGFNSRLGVGPIETLIKYGVEKGLQEMMSTTATHFDEGFQLNKFAWVTNICELGLVEAHTIYGYKNKGVVLPGLAGWLREIRNRWPDAKAVTVGEFGLAWRKQYKNNDNIDYRFVRRGSGFPGSEPEMEIRWFMNKNFRLALLHNWKEQSPMQVIDFTRYDLKAQEPADPKPGGHTRNWSLMNILNQKGLRPQDKPIDIGQLNAEELALIRKSYPKLIDDISKFNQNGKEK